MKMPAGRFLGREIETLPTWYLERIIDNKWILEAAEKELGQRVKKGDCKL